MEDLVTVDRNKYPFRGIHYKGISLINRYLGYPGYPAGLYKRRQCLPNYMTFVCNIVRVCVYSNNDLIII